MVLQQPARQELARDADRLVVFEETVRRPVRHVRAEVLVEPARGRSARDRLAEDLAPRGQVRLAQRRLIILSLGDLEQGTLLPGNRPIPAEMPLADTGGAVAVLFRQAGDRQPVGRDQRLAEHAHNAGLQPRPPVITAGQHRVPRGRADARGRMGICEPHALGGQAVQVRRGNLAALRVVAVHIAEPEIVREDHHDVRPLIICCHGRPEPGRGGDQEQDNEARAVQGTGSHDSCPLVDRNSADAGRLP